MFRVMGFAATAWLVAWHPAFASTAPDGLLSGYSLTSWHDDAGRPLGSVYAITQDRDGYLWIGTDAGLLRFDGSRFTPWQRLSDTPAPGSSVRALHTTRDGRLLIGFANGAGVGEIREGAFERHDNGLEGLDAVSELVEDGRGVKWAIADRTLYTFHADRWQRVRLPWRSRTGQVQDLYVSRTGQLWIGTRWGVFEHIEETNAFRRVSDEHVWGLAEDASGQMWTSDIVAGFRRLGAPAPPHHDVEGAGYRLAFDQQDDLWVGTFGHGLWYVRRNAGGFTIARAALSTGLSSNSIQSMSVDRDGNVWVGTTAGLHRFTKRLLTPLENVGFVLAIQPWRGGSVLAGTTNGLVRLEADNGRWKQVRLGSAAPDIRALYREAGGTLWVGASDGLWRYRGGRLNHVRLPSRSDMLLLSVSPDGRGGLWLGDGEWLYRWDGTALEPLALPPSSANLTRITSVRTDRSGGLWLGFDGQAIGRLDASGAFDLLGARQGWEPRTNQMLHAVYEDDEGIVWLGTSDGLHRFSGGRVGSVGRAQGFPGDRVWAIVEDSEGYLWLSVDRGLIRVARSEVARAMADPSHRARYRIYEPLEGLAGAPLGIINATRDVDGTLWFVRGGGVTHVHPRELPGDATAIGPVRIEEAVANDRRLTPSGHASLPPGTRRLEVSYTALAVGSTERLRFRYKLEGFDTDWVDAGSRRTAFYTNLSPRTYRFVVEAQSEEGAWHTSAAEWSFTIQPAIHETFLFSAACGLAALGGVWLAWNIRLQLVRRQFGLVLAERTRLSREIHDTLLQSLLGVALQFDVIAKALDPSSAAARDQLLRVRRQVESYIREARLSIWDLRSPLLDAQDLATALREFGRHAVGDSGVRFTSSVTGTGAIRSPRIENQLLRIGREAITNAVRHARAQRIHLDITFDESSVTLRVSDDGCGFEGDAGGRDADASISPTSGHYGLTTMRERAEELGGTLTIVTAVGRGTSIEAVIPVQAHATAELVAPL